ncbi:YhfH-like protein [Falsibacillus pallidus]|uniref:YhfH-like protein n=1 Tax=Falsibacillus pallidus TaxID=493781 RepID=A0A370GWG6_9BACI|nr:YhfH-like protein [Falsibacillus pallidus]
MKMLHNVLEFFKNLPAKNCSECGQQMDEQHECYGNKCDKCMGISEL